MTVETEIANLTSAINTLTGTVNERRAVLDAAVEDALTYAGQGDVSRQQAEAERLLAEAAKTGADTTKAAMDVALAAVTDYSDTLGLLNGAAKEIAAAADVVALFIYDTTKDSDGGAWRKRCRHTSWYNETLSTATRGSRREFPQKALIVARASSVTIYDLDTATCPMWMVVPYLVANPTVTTTVAASNGYLFIGHDFPYTIGLTVFDYVRDTMRAWYVTGAKYSLVGIAGRPANLTAWSAVYPSAYSGPALVNADVKSIAMTVLPGTPIDPVRGLPNPTVAVGTAGGVSVIHWDGRVCNSATTNAINAVSFGLDGTLFYATSASGAIYFSLASEYAAASFAARAYTTAAGNYPVVLAGTTAPIRATPNGFAKGGSSGLTLLRHEPGSGIAAGNQLNRSGVAYVTNSYNTGHMVGDIKMALSESTADLTSLVEATPLNDDFSSYADTAAMLAVWTTGGTNWSLSSGKALHASGSDVGLGRPVTLTEGGLYRVSWTVADRTNGGVAPQFSGGSAVVGVFGTSNGTVVNYLRAASGNNLFVINAQSSFDGSVDNIRIDLVASDRSIAANHPTVKGTLTRAAVASGAELAAYGGFSAANYLEVPYTSAFSFGTADFAICGWLKLAANSAIETLIERDSGATAQRWTLQVSAAGLPQWIVDDGTTTVTSAGTVAIDDARWHFVVAARRGANQELWIDGALVDSDTAPTLTLNNASAVLRVGESVAGGAPLTNGSLALLRIGATAPTPAQIHAIYEDERRLFEASAKCLLPGASVSALAYDDSTDLLHVATTAGSARMRGLLVVDKDATVYTGLDARAGILATRDSGSADIVLPSIPLREAAAAGIGHNGGPALYDRRTARAAGVTTNATPTVIARFPMDKGEFGQWVIRTVAREYDGGAELAAYEDVLLARRPGEGNIAISGSVTQRVIQEVTSSMAVSVAANTTTQCIEVTATGVASKNIEWSVEARLA